MLIEISNELMPFYEFAKFALVFVAFFALVGFVGSGLGYALYLIFDLIKSGINRFKEKRNGKDKDNEHRPGDI